MKVPMLDLKAEYAALKDEILPSLERVCQKAAFVLGEEVEAFEREFASYCGAKHCVGVNSGTAALHLGLLALGVGPNDEVLTSANSFLATAEAITYCGAKPVFVDIDPETANLDAKLLERAITSRTRAILPVHLYGRPADMDAIRKIAQQLHLGVLEDAAQAHGACYRGRRIGGDGPAAFSFYPTKNLGAYGEGGALTTNDDGMAQFARRARTHGQTARYEHAFIGFNYRMHGFEGAVLQAKLRHLEEWNARRREIAAEYRRLLSEARVELAVDDARDRPVFHQFVIFVDDRDQAAAQLAVRGIETAVHYPKPLHLQAAYAWLGHGAGDFPHSERACARVLSLPCFPGLTDEQVRYVAAAVLEVAGRK
jgi:dTDP-4-amino-4,6-dideoxygalactose transaminase